MNSKKYYCYNPIKKDFIKDMGVMYIDMDIHYKTGRKFWIFERTNILDEILKKWRIYQQMKFDK